MGQGVIRRVLEPHGRHLEARCPCERTLALRMEGAFLCVG